MVVVAVVAVVVVAVVAVVLAALSNLAQLEREERLYLQVVAPPFPALCPSLFCSSLSSHTVSVELDSSLLVFRHITAVLSHAFF